MVSLVIVDDHLMLLEVMGTALLGHGHSILAMEATPDDGVAAVLDLEPEVCLMDLGFPNGSGLSAIREISRSGVPTRTLVLTGREQDRVAEVRAAGASGLLAKASSVDALSLGIDRVARGEEVWPARTVVPAAPGVPSPLGTLTSREREVLDLLAAGARTGDIAAQLGMTLNTARTHVQRILTKLGVSTRFQAAHLLTQSPGVEHVDERRHS